MGDFLRSYFDPKHSIFITGLVVYTIELAGHIRRLTGVQSFSKNQFFEFRVSLNGYIHL